MEAIVHHHPADLSGRVQRWRAAPEALPAIVRDSHANRAARREPIRPAPLPVHHQRPSRTLLVLLVLFVAYVVVGVLIGLHSGGML